MARCCLSVPDAKIVFSCLYLGVGTLVNANAHAASKSEAEYFYERLSTESMERYACSFNFTLSNIRFTTE